MATMVSFQKVSYNCADKLKHITIRSNYIEYEYKTAITKVYIAHNVRKNRHPESRSNTGLRFGKRITRYSYIDETNAKRLATSVLVT